MRDEITDNFRGAVNAQETAEKIYILLTIEHPDLPAALHLNNSGINLISREQTFLASFIEAKILDDDPARSPQAQLTVGNVNRTIVAALRATPVPCLITMEVVLGSDLDTVEMSLSNLELRNINYNELTIQGDLIPRRLRPRKAIDYYFSPTICPGLFP